MRTFKTSILVAAVLVSGMLAGCAGPTTDRLQSAARSVPEPGSSLGIASVPNLRDLYLEGGSRVAPGAGTGAATGAGIDLSPGILYVKAEFAEFGS